MEGVMVEVVKNIERANKNEGKGNQKEERRRERETGRNMKKSWNMEEKLKKEEIEIDKEGYI